MTHARWQGRQWGRRTLIRRGGLLAGAGVGAWLLACGGSKEAGESGASRASETAVPVAADAPPRGRIVAGISADAGSLDPHSLAGGGPGNWMVADLFDSISTVTRVNRAVVPGAAESWRVLDDKLTWEVKLRPGTTFHDGEPLDAEAVKFSYDRQFGRAAYNLGFKPNGYLRNIAEVRVVDPLTVQIVTQQPNPLPNDLATPLVPPRFIAEKGDDEYAKRGIGTGPMRLVEFKRGESITLEANDAYFRRQRDPDLRSVPYVKTVVQRIIPEDETRIAALQAGEVDFIFQTPVDAIKRLKAEKDIAVAVSHNNAPVVISVNWLDETDPAGKPNPLRDRRVRQAIAYAIDVDGIIKGLLTGEEKRNMLLASGSLGWRQRDPWPFDTTKAKALLVEAGYSDGFETQLSYANGRYNKAAEICEAIAGYLGRAGIRVKTVALADYGTQAGLLRSKKLPGLALFGQAGGIYAYNAFFKNVVLSSGTNANHPPVPEIETLAQQAVTEFDEEKRKSLIDQVITRLLPEMWFVPLWELPQFYAFNTRKLAYEPSPFAEDPEWDRVQLKG